MLKRKSIFAALILSLVLCTGLTFGVTHFGGKRTAQAAGAPSSVMVNSVNLYEDCYLEKNDSTNYINGATTEPSDYVAWYSGGILTLNNYNAGQISTGGGDLTIELKGNNTITALGRGIVASDCDNIIIDADSEATLNINVSSTKGLVFGISVGNGLTATSGSVTIQGKTTVNIVCETSVGDACGIFTKTGFNIIESASLSVKNTSSDSASYDSYGIVSFENKPVFNTDGVITLDNSECANRSYCISAYGIDMQKGTLICKYKPGQTYSYAVTQRITTAPEGCVLREAPYYLGETVIKSGEGHTVTVKNGEDYFGSNTNQYVAGETVSIKTEKTGLEFKKWMGEGVTLAEEDAAKKETSFVMPAADVTVTADYNVFLKQPSFKRESDTSGSVSFRVASEPAGNDYYCIKFIKKSGEKIERSFTKDETSEDFTYYYNVTSDAFVAGEYKISVAYYGYYFYSDFFKIDYSEGTAPVITSIGGKPVESETLALPVAFAGKPYADNDGNNYKIIASGTDPLTYKAYLGADPFMPEGLTLDSATGEISGTPTTAGVYNISFSVSNEYGFATVLGTIYVYEESDKPEITTLSLPNGNVGAEYDQAIEFSGSKTYFYPSLTDAPEWLKIRKEGTKAWVYGTPDKTGTYTFTVSIDNVAGVASKKYTIVIGEEAVAPKIAKELFVFKDDYSKFDEYGALCIVRGLSVDIIFAATGTNTEDNPMTWSVEGELPKGLTFDVSSARLYGTVPETVALSSINNKYYTVKFIATNKSKFGSSISDSFSQLVLYKNGWKESVTVSPESAAMDCGENKKFTATVLGFGVVDQTVIWSVSGDITSADTKIAADGTLTIGANETAANIDITATAENEAGLNVYATVTVTIDHTHKFETKWSHDENKHWHASTCGHEVKDGEAEHDFDDGVVTTEPTEETTGVKTYTCGVCEYQKTEVIEKLEHTHKFETKWSHNETSHWHASACGHEVKGGEAEHDFDDGVVTTEPTEETAGVKTYTCGVCEYQKTEEIAKLEHTHKFETKWSHNETSHWHASTCGHEVKDGEAAHAFGAGVVTKQPTETSYGVKTYTCRDCGYKKHESISKLAHTHKMTAVAEKKATCTENGKKAYYVCSGCGRKFADKNGVNEITNESSLIIAAAHSFGEWVEEVPATTEKEGVKAHKDCTVCKKHFDNNGAEIKDLTIAKTSGEDNPGGDSSGSSSGSSDTGSSDNTGSASVKPADKNNGLSGGAIAGIAVGSVAVAGVGGFAIFWFAIKKKSFADIIALFKKK